MTQKYYKDDVLPSCEYCDVELCGEYDGKRCRKMGCRPGNLCEPAVIDKLKAPKTAHIVCMNDGTEAVVIGTVEEATAIMDRMKAQDQEEYRDKHEMSEGGAEDRASFLFWHLHSDVKILKPDR